MAKTFLRPDSTNPPPAFPTAEYLEDEQRRQPAPQQEADVRQQRELLGTSSTVPYHRRPSAASSSTTSTATTLEPAVPVPVPAADPLLSSLFGVNQQPTPTLIAPRYLPRELQRTTSGATTLVKKVIELSSFSEGAKVDQLARGHLPSKRCVYSR